MDGGRKGGSERWFNLGMEGGREEEREGYRMEGGTEGWSERRKSIKSQMNVRHFT